MKVSKENPKETVEVAAASSETETKKRKDPPAAAAEAESPTETGTGKAAAETESESDSKPKEEKKKRKPRRTKKVELDENGDPIPKKKRKLNHQCAAVKMCHSLMQEYRGNLSEADQAHLAKFCQLNRGDQGIMFNKMCVTMRTHLKEKYPELQQWEDMDFDEEDKRPEYAKVVNFLLDDYMEEKRKAPVTVKIEEEVEGDGEEKTDA